MYNSFIDNEYTSPIMHTQFNIACDSSEQETDPYSFADAIEKAFGGLIVNIEIGPDNAGWDDDLDDSDYTIPNLGQYTQRFEIEMTRPMSIEEFDAIMETVDGDSFGFGNGWDHE